LHTLPLARAADAVASRIPYVDSPLAMRIVRIFTTNSGESAIEVREVPMSESDRPMSETFKCSAIFFRETPAGHVQDLHNAPRRQLIFLTSGILELESSEGRRFVCRPGDLIFAEDVQGKGHITRSLRDTRGFVHVTMPEDFDVSRWPLAEA
jgi:quercetin dioxygenase-like cupin family protein